MTDRAYIEGLALAREVLWVRPVAAPEPRHRMGAILRDHAAEAPRRGEGGQGPGGPDYRTLQAAVNGSQVLSFTAGLTPAEKADVLAATQFAQRAASAAHDRFADTAAWYRFYTDVLERLGWAGQGLAFTRRRADRGRLTLDRAALDVIAAIATSNQLALLVKAVDALRALPEEAGALTLFERLALAGDSGSFQLGAVQKADNGALSLALGGFHFRTRTDRTRALFGEWGADEAELWAAAQVMTLDRSHYDGLRDTVTHRLAEGAAGYILDLPLA